MRQNKFLKAGLLTLFLLLGFIISWESYLRSKGVNIAYDDGGVLWSYKRGLVYEPSDKATVFIGPSRMKYDLDIETWKKLTGEQAVQLAIEGESPLAIFDDLAADKNFKGKLVIDVTEGLFFTSNPASLSTSKKYIANYKKRTPAQKASFQLNRPLESQFVFLDQDNFSMQAFLEKLDVPNRPGVFAIPNRWPMEFGRISFDRQDIMMDKFLTDTSLQKKVTGNWLFFASINREPPATGHTLDSFLTVAKNNCDKIKARGGQVLFVRTPSSGWYWEGEKKIFPREKYWDRILSFTGCQGIHFKDYPAIDHFICPEWSHLAPKDAVLFTENLVQILEKDKGWKFPHKNSH
jgi:hypothetical protein